MPAGELCSAAEGPEESWAVAWAAPGRLERATTPLGPSGPTSTRQEYSCSEALTYTLSGCV
jgi:hypothetical protein